MITIKTYQTKSSGWAYVAQDSTLAVVGGDVGFASHREAEAAGQQKYN